MSSQVKTKGFSPTKSCLYLPYPATVKMNKVHIPCWFMCSIAIFTNFRKTSQGQCQIWPNVSKKGTAAVKLSNESRQPLMDKDWWLYHWYHAYHEMHSLKYHAKNAGQIIILCMHQSYFSVFNECNHHGT